ncbi:MAG: FtsX-like permease family protein, partial [Gemmatimonadaceae bacterium]
DVVFGPSRPLLYLLLCAVGLLLLVAFVNVANLLLARGTTRMREIAIRSALGATTRRVGRQLLVESLTLGVVGGAVGIVCAVLLLQSLLSLAPADIPRLGEVRIDAGLAWIAVAASLAIGVAFGSVPMWQARRVDVVHALRGDASAGAGGRKRRTAREVLVVTAVALSVTMSVSAALLVRSFRNLMDADPGFSAASVVKAEYQLPTARYPRDFSKWPNLPEILNFNNALLERAASIPGVQSAAIAGAHPLDPGFTNSWVIIGREAEARDFPEISVRTVSPSYFETTGGVLVRGRALSGADDGNAPFVALINEATAKRFFSQREAIGAQLAFWGRAKTIVGIVRDERIHGLREAAPAAVYLPLAQAPTNGGVLLVRTTRAPEALGTELQRAIWSVDPQLAVYGVEPLTRTILRSVSASRFAMIVLGVFAGITVLLALIGVHGVVSYLAAQRTKEIGIRVALGADRGAVTGLVVRSGLALGAIGVAVGIGGAWALTKLLSTLLYGVTRADTVSFVTVGVGMLAAAALSAYLPARRAARVSPLVAIRSD